MIKRERGKPIEGLKTTEAQRRASLKYDEKTYRRILLRLRKEEDWDIIESYEKAKVEGKKAREWIRGLYEK